LRLDVAVKPVVVMVVAVGATSKVGGVVSAAAMLTVMLLSAVPVVSAETALALLSFTGPLPRLMV
jgi:hypothetical protein